MANPADTCLRDDLDAMRERAKAAEKERDAAQELLREHAALRASEEEVCTDDDGRPLICVECREPMIVNEGGWSHHADGVRHSHACEGRYYQRERDAARAQAAAEAARAERLVAALWKHAVLGCFCPPESCRCPDGPHARGYHGHATDCVALQAALALTPTAALAEHDAARDAEIARLHAMVRRLPHAPDCTLGQRPRAKCDCGICTVDRHGHDPKTCPAPRHYAHGKDCAVANEHKLAALGCSCGRDAVLADYDKEPTP